MDKKIVPLKDRILVQQIEETQSSGGIFIPSTNSNENIILCKVIAIGKDIEEIEPEDTVALDKNLGVFLDVEGQKYIVIKEKDILVVFM